jgi:hypothetical protein
VRIQCDEPRRVAERFALSESTLGLDVTGSTVCIRTADPGGFYKALNALVVEDGIEVASLDCPDDNLQSVFDYLVK